MPGNDRLPATTANGFGAYDIDALMVDIGGDAGNPAEEAERNLCATLADLYTSRSRFQIVDLLEEFLEPGFLTATELLHSKEAQRQYVDWHRRPLVLESLAKAQARPGRRTPAMRLEELRCLEQEVVTYTEQHAGRGVPARFDARTYTMVASRVLEADPGFGGRFALDTVLTAWLSECGSVEVKAVRLLSLAGDGIAAAGLAILDQILGEILASAAGIAGLFGWIDGLRPTLEAMIHVWKGEAVAHPHVPAVIRRLVAFTQDYAVPATRQGLEISIQRVLLGDGELSANDTADMRSLGAVVDEMLATGLMLGKCRTSDGRTIGGDRTRRLFDLRIARQLTGERLAEALSNKSHTARLIDLLTLEGVVFGDASRRLVVGAIQKEFEHRDFVSRMFETARTPRARIKVLSDIQRRVLRATLPDAAKDKFARMLDEMQLTFLRTNRVLARIAGDKTPAVEDVMEFANLCAESAFTEPRCGGAVRDLVSGHVLSTPFLRAYLLRCKEETERRAELFAHFFGTLAAAGVGLRDMSSLKVLVADDEPQARTYVEMILRDLGISGLYLAEDGREALALFKAHENDIDLIVCDWKMPRLSGLEFLKYVRSLRQDLPFLMVTALATMIAVEEAMAHDVTAYIAKPFSPEQLEEKVLVLVNRR